MNYYNEFDPYAAQWLRNLIAAGLIPDGYVDDRPIQEVRPDELREYTQCHFFAGIGGWPLALSLAGWPSDRPVWTGSCPCQPFSVAGKRKGATDERHLWPFFYGLIRECAPGAVFGEQVASKDGLGWFAGVQADLEAEGYRANAVDLCAAGVGAPHIRQRLFWVADSRYGERGRAMLCKPGGNDSSERNEKTDNAPRCIADGDIRHEPGRDRTDASGPAAAPGGDSRVAHGHETECGRRQEPEREQRGVLYDTDRSGHDGPASTGKAGRWSDFVLIPCADGKARRIKPGLMPLAHGVPGRVGQIRAYGNAIVPEAAAEFIKAYMALSQSSL